MHATASSDAPTKSPLSGLQRRRRVTAVVVAAISVALLIAVALSARVIPPGGEAKAGKMDVDSYAAEQFGEVIRPQVAEDARPLADVLTALATDPAAAAKEFGAGESAGAAVYATTFTGVVSAVEANRLAVVVPGVPSGTTVSVQTSAVSGTLLRDVTGRFRFPDFANQLEYQSFGNAINALVPTTVLKGMDLASLTGKTVTVTGVFQPIVPTTVTVSPTEVVVGGE
jgi:predicted lipoprotein